MRRFTRPERAAFAFLGAGLGYAWAVMAGIWFYPGAALALDLLGRAAYVVLAVGGALLAYLGWEKRRVGWLLIGGLVVGFVATWPSRLAMLFPFVAAMAWALAGWLTGVGEPQEGDEILVEGTVSS